MALWLTLDGTICVKFSGEFSFFSPCILARTWYNTGMKNTPLTVFVVLISLSSSEEVLDSLHSTQATAIVRQAEIMAEWPNAEVVVEERPVL